MFSRYKQLRIENCLAFCILHFAFRQWGSGRRGRRPLRSRLLLPIASILHFAFRPWVRPVAHRCAPLRRPVQAETRGASRTPPPTIASPIAYCLLPQFCILHSDNGCVPWRTGVRRYGGRCRRKPAGRRGRRPLRSRLLLPIACCLLPQFCILRSAFCIQTMGASRGAHCAPLRNPDP